ncbi:hypothetical protein WN48_08389 [Eufriesea mexicana]|nr:hypothetical protein WN48_08389 [Eufriesea mexicana]
MEACNIMYEKNKQSVIYASFPQINDLCCAIWLRSITVELYKSCLIYTLQTKIAPLWNKVGDYFIQGKNFYDSIEGTRALKIEIFMEDKKPTITYFLSDMLVKLPAVCGKQLQISKYTSFNIDQDITVETMAKKNQLNQMKNSELSDWLQRHSIPYKSKAKKTELVNTVLSHMKNTQILQQIRM